MKTLEVGSKVTCITYGFGSVKDRTRVKAILVSFVKTYSPAKAALLFYPATRKNCACITLAAFDEVKGCFNQDTKKLNLPFFWSNIDTVFAKQLKKVLK